MAKENSGGQVSYYTAHVQTVDGHFITVECIDIIEALGMDFAEGEAFKAIWRKSAARKYGARKQGHDETGLRDAEKVVYFGQRMAAAAQRAHSALPVAPVPGQPKDDACACQAGEYCALCKTDNACLSGCQAGLISCRKLYAADELAFDDMCQQCKDEYTSDAEILRAFVR